MPEIVYCPFCKEKLSEQLIVDFYYCPKCKVAVRNENDMPCKGFNIYCDDWVSKQENNLINQYRAYNILSEIRNLPNLPKGCRILDIGCGIGILVDILKHNGYSAEGIDTSPKAIDYAIRQKEGDFKVSSIEKYNVDQKYHIIIASQLIEHLRKPESFLTEIKKRLNPDGFLIIETPNLASWKKGSIWRTRIGGMFYGEDHRIIYTDHSLSNLLQINDFSVFKVLTKTFSPTICNEIVITLYETIQNKKKIGESTYAYTAVKYNRSFITYLGSIYDYIAHSTIFNLFFTPFNKLTERKNRGNQLLIIAKKKEYP